MKRKRTPRAYPGPLHTSNMKSFTKIVSFNYSCNAHHLRCWLGSRLLLWGCNQIVVYFDEISSRTLERIIFYCLWYSYVQILFFLISDYYFYSALSDTSFSVYCWINLFSNLSFLGVNFIVLGVINIVIQFYVL